MSKILLDVIQLVKWVADLNQDVLKSDSDGVIFIDKEGIKVQWRESTETLVQSYPYTEEGAPKEDNMLILDLEQFKRWLCHLESDILDSDEGIFTLDDEGLKLEKPGSLSPLMVIKRYNTEPKGEIDLQHLSSEHNVLADLLIAQKGDTAEVAFKIGKMLGCQLKDIGQIMVKLVEMSVKMDTLALSQEKFSTAELRAIYMALRTMPNIQEKWKQTVTEAQHKVREILNSRNEKTHQNVWNSIKLDRPLPPGVKAYTLEEQEQVRRLMLEIEKEALSSLMRQDGEYNLGEGWSLVSRGGIVYVKKTEGLEKPFSFEIPTKISSQTLLKCGACGKEETIEAVTRTGSEWRFMESLERWFCSEKCLKDHLAGTLSSSAKDRRLDREGHTLRCADCGSKEIAAVLEPPAEDDTTVKCAGCGKVELKERAMPGQNPDSNWAFSTFTHEWFCSEMCHREHLKRIPSMKDRRRLHREGHTLRCADCGSKEIAAVTEQSLTVSKPKESEVQCSNCTKHTGLSNASYDLNPNTKWIYKDGEWFCSERCYIKTTGEFLDEKL